ncbi:MAG: MBL fold metallo-hydrolase [Cyanobacteria bacterium SIG27]|nr:MBL fold metallo-hydrolase [Cyanobacteria bacterium SIG27]MBQ9150279.1 MBL fold metallo-hydrolase [bacterium]
MKIKSFPNGIYGAITYLVYDEISKEGAIVDCTCAIDEIKEIVEKEKINLKYALITHGHFDHVYCISDVKNNFSQTQILIHKEDMILLDEIKTQCAMAGIEEIKIPCIDALITDESHNLTLGENKIEIIHTKGHSKGGVCYLINDILFSGDTLFQGSIGRCDLWGGSMTEIEESIKNKLFKLDDNITVYPGHGDKTTIGYEKKYNPYFGSNY